MSPSASAEKKGHVCPPSKATHPSDRWESLFIYAFICRFTPLRGKIEGMETPMDFENALLSHEPNPILSQILGQFVLNLRPQTRNLSTDQISATVASVIIDYFSKSSERTVFWNDDLKRNVDPFQGLDGGFFAADWDLKLKVLRYLVELQLCHTAEVKNAIDRAWGVSQNKHKKKETASAPPDPTDPRSQEKLQLVPLGQDAQRNRYWVADDSPRIYLSTNPWKMTATFETLSSTREEYWATVESLKASSPSPLKEGQRKTKFEVAHLALIQKLEDRKEVIDAEIAVSQFLKPMLAVDRGVLVDRITRVNKARKKMEQRVLLLAQAEVRETRTRRQTRRPDYVYNEDPDSEEGGDDYTYQEPEDEEYNEGLDEDDFLNFRTDYLHAPGSHRTSSGKRRSSRTAVLNGNGKRSVPDGWGQWRGERRSSRLGAPPDTQFDELSAKRARTEESNVSSTSMDGPVATTSGQVGSNGLKPAGAAAVKPSEIALEEVAGRKKSKFWFYAVEPVSVPTGSGGEVPHNGPGLNNQPTNGGANPAHGEDSEMDESHERSLSPAPSVNS